MFRLTVLAVAIASPLNAGGLAPETSPIPAPRAEVRGIEFRLCPAHTPWNLCDGEPESNGFAPPSGVPDTVAAPPSAQPDRIAEKPATDTGKPGASPCKSSFKNGTVC